VLRKGGKAVTILLGLTARAVDLVVGERFAGRSSPPQTVVGRLDHHGVARIVRRVARRAGIAKPIGPHTPRHAFIIIIIIIIAALCAGVPLRDVQEAASQAEPGATTRYVRLGG